MATLAADKPRSFEFNGGDPSYNELPIIASDTVYAGAAVGESSTSGTYRPLAGGDTFAGFCVEKCANESGGASAQRIKLRQRGSIKLAVTGVSSAATGRSGATVYASDDDTFTLTATGGSSIGKIQRWISSSSCWVEFEGASKRSI